MMVFLNGKFVPEKKAVVSVFDRGFLYGDGLYEGVAFCHGRPFRWAQHMTRLAQGLQTLRMEWPISADELLKGALRLVALNKMPETLARISISRGITERGYSPKNAAHPAVVITTHPLPNPTTLPRWRVHVASQRLPMGDALSAFKTANKLPQVLARAEADDAGAQEAVLLNARGFLAEATTSNLFWLTGSTLCTPPLAAGPLPGVTRAAVFDLCRQKKIRVKEINARPSAVPASDGAFLSMSSWGIVEIEKFDGARVRRSPLVAELWRDYRALLSESCQGGG
ncbi:MAG TPA: aminotransferase class IV [Verrucomicrobiae bacterium]|jgi:aminodeoxychorismate lyase|nr:aminotransferase class IV [Verrucomicrobiae bacterium]